MILIEPLVFHKMKEERHANRDDTEGVKEFMEVLQILLIAYHNMGMVSLKQGSFKYSTKVFDQGWRLAKKFFGPQSNWAKKFK